MELYHLRTFVKVAEVGNLTRASEALFTSQPAISGHIKALEDELGLRLFSRSAKGMSLTPVGQQLFSYAQATLQAAASFKHAAQGLKNELVGELKVGVHTDFDFVRTGPLYSTMMTNHPKVSMQFLQSSSALVVNQLRHSELDVGFMFGPCNVADIENYFVADVDMVVVGPSAWSDRVVNAPLSVLAEMPWVYTSERCPFFHLIEAMFANKDYAANQHAWVDTEDAVRELVKSGVGLSVLRRDDAQRMAAAGDVCIWSGEVLSIGLSLAVYKRRKDEPVIEAFKQAVFDAWGVNIVAQSA